MIETMTSIGVIVVCLGWFALPLLPTLLEVRRRAEAQPLAIDREHDGDVRHFARRFRSYLESNFQDPSFEERVRQGVAREGQLNDRTPYQIVETDGAKFLDAMKAASSVPALAIFSGAITLPDRLKFPFGVYAAGNIQTGQEAIIRSLYGEGDVFLRRATAVLRWTHAKGVLTVARNSSVFGRATAEGGMRIGGNVEFERLHSRRIIFGEMDTSADAASESLSYPAYLPPSRPMAEDCFSIDGDLDIPPRTLVRGDFVVRGKIHIGRHARVEGSLKSYNDFHLESGVTITGSAVSGRDLRVDADCRVHGPTVASRKLRIGPACRIGSEERMASAIAPSIRIAPGTVVYGTVWAREDGRVGGPDAD